MVSVDKLDVACYQAQAAAANYNYLDPLATKIPIPLVLAYQYPFFWYFLFHSFGASYSFLWHFPTQFFHKFRPNPFDMFLLDGVVVSWFILIP